jgi:hypothetical protein
LWGWLFTEAQQRVTGQIVLMLGIVKVIYNASTMFALVQMEAFSWTLIASWHLEQNVTFLFLRESKAVSSTHRVKKAAQHVSVMRKMGLRKILNAGAFYPTQSHVRALLANVTLKPT